MEPLALSHVRGDNPCELPRSHRRHVLARASTRPAPRQRPKPPAPIQAGRPPSTAHPPPPAVRLPSSNHLGRPSWAIRMPPYPLMRQRQQGPAPSPPAPRKPAPPTVPAPRPLRPPQLGDYPPRPVLSTRHRVLSRDPHRRETSHKVGGLLGVFCYLTVGVAMVCGRRGWFVNR